MIKVYTWPDCPNCDTLKAYLAQRGVIFSTLPFTTDEQTRLIMKNIFGSTPILERNERVLVSEDIFDGYNLDESLVEDILSD